MRNWKELGEIPDSEEEDGFDSQGSWLQQGPSPEMTDSATDKKHDNIWDVPLSQDEEAPVAVERRTPANELPQAAFTAGNSKTSDSWDVPLSQEDLGAAEGQNHRSDKPSPSADAVDPVSSPLSTLSSIFFDEDDRPSTLGLSGVTSSHGSPQRQRTPAPTFIDMTSGTPSPTTSRPLRALTPVISSELGERESEYVARQAAVRYERSLRTRKPIQQHPFLLEAAQYRSSMQSRGLKPLRIAAIETHGRRRDGETQEIAYEPESQNSNGGNDSGSHDMGSQILGNFDDDMIFASSSPPTPPRAAFVAEPSSQMSSPLETDNTSLQMDDSAAPDELPALEELLSHSRRPSNKYTPKRRPTSPRTSSKKKQRRLVLDSDDILPPGRSSREVSIDPLQEGQSGLPPSSSLEPVPNFMEARLRSLLKQPNHVRPQRSRSPGAPPIAPATLVIESASEPDDFNMNHTDGSESAAEGNEQIVNTVGRTIRGVLPASWLRLDQKIGRDNIRKAVTSRNIHKSPARENRRGVAQKRKGAVSTGWENNKIWSDDSDVETLTAQQATTDEAYPNQTRLMVDQVMDVPGSLDFASSDDGSGMEDNQVDHMLAPRKRQMKLVESFQGAGNRQKTPQNAATLPRRKTGPRQPKITNAFAGVAEASSTALRMPKKHGKRNRVHTNATKERSSGPKKKKSVLPRTSSLSILDVIEPDAPRFLKIAARSAKQRRNQGRSSPSHKTIRLANREDHIDALSVLYQWRSGSIPQRASVTSSLRKRGGARRAQPLSEASGNQDHPRLGSALRKSYSVQGPAQQGSDTLRKSRMARSLSTRSFGENAVRPAQLETSGLGPLDSRVFHFSKRALDKLFKKNRTATSTVGIPSASVDLSLGDDGQDEPRRITPARQQQAAAPPLPKPSEKSRYRKQTKPLREDLEAPQFVHAHDPLPTLHAPVDVMQPTEPQGSGVKMTGLGPYGTEYTHHFEIFPLPAGTFFHETSLLGRGLLSAIVDHPNIASEDMSRTRLSYTLGDRILRWGPWSEQVSSELGILFDFITEKLEEPCQSHGDMLTLTKATEFPLLYIKEHMSFERSSDAKAFFTRFREVLCAFNDKVKGQLLVTGATNTSSTAMQRIYDRILLASLSVLQLCRNEAIFVSEQIQAEDMLKAVGTTAVSMLMQIGTGDLRQTYKTLSSFRTREKGLREEGSTIHSWVVLMKVLDEARILRASFWDLVHANLSTRDHMSSHDAEKHDLLWQDMFSFLPLVEFNNVGVVVPGSRQDVFHEGWSLPQKLLKTVFQLYSGNDHQPPSFNNYCRALVGRCHYLVEQWGWKKTSSVVGIIFDFFGSQHLEHLRNEEVYKSPAFLESLAGDPKLEIEPEDRCFHVFLKFVALSIRRLREIDATKDIRNLVARTMPNHSRQYLKEDTLRERDLAALRNHHDLLCTLFWACPPDLRPSPALIEGLVDPASSHKETCLINLRAWSQLARFLVSNGEASTAKVFKPFVQWRDTFFSKMLLQHSSIASEINQQFHSLAKEERQGVSDDMLKAMISMNKNAVQDVLHFSVTASYDVMVQCPDLESAVWSLSIKSLQQIFDHFSAAPPELDWSILTVTLKTLDAFIRKIDDFKDAEESQERESQLLDSEQADDALQTLDECVAKKYFAMARCVLSSRGDGDKAGTIHLLEKATCKELVVTLSSRFASRLVSSGSMQLGQLFKYSKYGLFDTAPHKLDLDQRRYLVLCVLSLLKANQHHFGDVGFTLLDLWMLAIVKPREGLCWENQLAEQLHRTGADFIPEAVVGLAVQPHYNSNRDMFEFAISHMRTQLRDAEFSQRKALLIEYAQTLKAVMEQMATDLRTISQDPTEHPAYVSFVRGIISLIRSHGADICAVDDFFYQISRDYSPPAEDPQLQIAGMIAYELKLNEAGARQQLFFFMFNSFKLAMDKDQLGEHVGLISSGIKRPAIRQFMLGKLLPAALLAAWQQHPAHILVDLCMAAFDVLLQGSILSTELTTDDLDPLLTTIAAIATGFRQLSAVPINTEVHLINRAVSFMNLVWPSLMMLKIKRLAPAQLDAVQHALSGFLSCFQIVRRHLEVSNGYPVWETSNLVGASLRQTVLPDASNDPDIASFRDNIIMDVQRNWNVGERRIGIKTPAKSRGTQSSTQAGQGVEVPDQDVTKLYSEMRFILAIWIDSYEELFEEGVLDKEVNVASLYEDFLF
ncbi:hypothetical protein NLU13_6764 [Sarocladium strictum]|uniref:Uncharacterized protein n=1 Tax=Sarocladium strictum TaxID=5046 RepID=A0AA39GEJ4_SARSR|nr:hypothetical protein NLU13_6764 [Sarocladium strictum]